MVGNSIRAASSSAARRGVALEGDDMSDIKLFRMSNAGVTELAGGAVNLEKSLQTLFEKNLEGLLGVRFLASEFPTEGGRMDTLGIDENTLPSWLSTSDHERKCHQPSAFLPPLARRPSQRLRMVGPREVWKRDG